MLLANRLNDTLTLNQTKRYCVLHCRRFFLQSNIYYSTLFFSQFLSIKSFMSYFVGQGHLEKYTLYIMLSIAPHYIVYLAYFLVNIDLKYTEHKRIKKKIQ